MNIYEISTRYQQLLDQDSYTDEESRELEELHGSIEDECISRGKYIKNLEAEYNAVRNVINDMEMRAHDLLFKANKQRDKMIERMALCGIAKITKSPLFALVIKKNPYSVNILDESVIPEKYKKTKVVTSIDKTKIRDELICGEMVAGTELIQNLRLEIK